MSAFSQIGYVYENAQLISILIGRIIHIHSYYLNYHEINFIYRKPSSEPFNERSTVRPIEPSTEPSNERSIEPYTVQDAEIKEKLSTADEISTKSFTEPSTLQEVEIKSKLLTADEISTKPSTEPSTLQDAEIKRKLSMGDEPSKKQRHIDDPIANATPEIEKPMQQCIFQSLPFMEWKTDNYSTDLDYEPSEDEDDESLDNDIKFSAQKK